MVDVSFLYNYKGALYPVEINRNTSEEENTAQNIPGLLDLAANKLVQDAATIRRAIKFLPMELFHNLMRSALLHAKDRCVEILVTNWPWKILSLCQFVPPLFSNVKTLCDDEHLCESMRRGVKYTTCLAHTFVECLKKRAPTKLKYLDLTGYPAAEVIVNYLSSHVLLVQNETRQKEIVRMYNEVTEGLPPDQKQTYNVDTTLPEETFVISIDAFLQSEETHMELCRALKSSKCEHSRFRLQVNKVDMSSLGVARISVLLEQVDISKLSALSLQYNSIMNEGMVILTPAFRNLSVLTSLDLSCNNINTSDEHVTDLLKESLEHMPKLKRLDLSNNRLKYRLRRILSSVREGLEYLKLAGCCLHDMDFRYLKLSHHCKALKHVDLSENNVGRSFDQFMRIFLEAVQSSVMVIELAHCDMIDSQWMEFMSMVGGLQFLHYLNISRNGSTLGIRTVFETFNLLPDVQNLEAAVLSYPTECYYYENPEVNQGIDEPGMCRRNFEIGVNGIVEDSCMRKGRGRIHVQFCS